MRLLINHTIAGAADFIEMARRDDPTLFVVATHERDDTPISLQADVFLHESKGHRQLEPEAYAHWLLTLAQEHEVDVVMPYRRRDELASFSGLFTAAGIKLLVAASPQHMTFIEDKAAFLDEVAGLRVPITPFALFEDVAGYNGLRARHSLDALFPGHRGPLCVKPSSGIYGAGFRIIREDGVGSDAWPSQATRLSDISTLETSHGAFRALLGSLPGKQTMMLMPFMPGVERSVDFACLDGRLLGTVTRVKQGTSQRLFHDQAAEDLADLLARRYTLSGVLNLQTIEDDKGVQRLMELNTRASGGIGMTGLTNVNLPGLLFRAIAGGEISSMPDRVEDEIRVARREVFWKV